MSAKYYVCADQDKGGHWNFTREQLVEIAAETRPGSEVTGPFGDIGAYEINVPSEQGWTCEVIYQPRGMGFSFEDEDEIHLTAGLVFQVLQRLAPEVPALWLVSYDAEIHPLQIAGRTEDDFIEELGSA